MTPGTGLGWAGIASQFGEIIGEGGLEGVESSIGDIESCMSPVYMGQILDSAQGPEDTGARDMSEAVRVLESCISFYFKGERGVSIWLGERAPSAPRIWPKYWTPGLGGYQGPLFRLRRLVCRASIPVTVSI